MEHVEVQLIDLKYRALLQVPLETQKFYLHRIRDSKRHLGNIHLLAKEKPKVAFFATVRQGSPFLKPVVEPTVVCCGMLRCQCFECRLAVPNERSKDWPPCLLMFLALTEIPLGGTQDACRRTMCPWRHCHANPRSPMARRRPTEHPTHAPTHLPRFFQHLSHLEDNS